ncbi:MAG: RNA methyltransferase [Deinococcota bacterium]|nr:RNA methyltransferase [Deinococcota bacterium]
MSDVVSDLRFVLVRPKDPRNMGSSARAVKNFGFADLWLVAPQRLLNAEAFALAAHAQEVLRGAVRCASVREAVADRTLVLGTTARPRTAAREVYTPRQAAALIRGRRAALLFGPEDFGLSNEDLSYCQGFIQIPTADYASLNLAQAVQVLAYECFQGRLQGAPEQEAPEQGAGEQGERALASRAAIEAMYDHLHETMHLIGYTDRLRERAAMAHFRNLFDRAGLTAKDVMVLRGLWRQAQWAARQDALGLPESLKLRREE